MDKETATEEKSRISYISVISFVLSPLGIIWYLMYYFINSLGIVDEGEKIHFMAITFILLLVPFIAGIVDLFKKNRRKTLSKLAVAISGIPLLIFTLVTLFIMLVLR